MLTPRPETVSPTPDNAHTQTRNGFANDDVEPSARDAFQATIVRKGVADAHNGDVIKIVPDPVTDGRYVLEVVTPEGSRSVVGDTAASIERAQEQAVKAARLNPEFRPKSSQTETVSDPEPSPKDATVSSKPEEEREPTDEELDAAMDAEWNAPEPEPPPKAKPAKGASKSKKPRSKVGKKTGAAVVNSNQEVVLRVGLSRPGVNSGGAHDLSDNVPKGVKLIVLTFQGYPGE